ncbi:hypothetical protein ACK3Z7_06325 [Aeromonas caviae]
MQLPRAGGRAGVGCRAHSGGNGCVCSGSLGCHGTRPRLDNALAGTSAFGCDPGSSAGVDGTGTYSGSRSPGSDCASCGPLAQGGARVTRHR